MCRKTQNYHKISSVLILLISNELNNIGIKFGLRPRKKKKDEKIYEYMQFIQKILLNNFNFYLFEEKCINKIQGIELEFLRNKGQLSKGYIKLLVEIYYKLRRIEIPDLNSKIREIFPSELNSFQFNHKNFQEIIKGANNHDHLNSFMLNLLERDINKLANSLKNNYNKVEFENLLHLNILKKNLQKRGFTKIKLKGKLMDNITYSLFLDNLIGYLFLGITSVGFMLGFILTIEMMFLGIYFSNLPVDYSYFLLLFYGISFFFLFLFNKYFYQKKNQ